MKRTLVTCCMALCMAGAVRADSISFKIGYYQPSCDSDLWKQNIRYMTIEADDFNQFTFSSDADFFIGNYVNLEIGTGYYEKSVTSEDREYEFENGTPIRQEFHLRIVPLEGSIKLYPVGRERPIFPYVGAGFGAYFWEYVESGDFIVNRNTNPRVISGVYDTQAISPGYHFKAGVQVPVGSQATIDGEVKYVVAHGDLSSAFDPEFEPFDLGGLWIGFGASFWF